MKLIYTMLGLLLVFVACSNGNSVLKNVKGTPGDTSRFMELVSAEEFNEQIKKTPGVILDVRTPGEYKKGFIKDARLMDIFNDSFDTELAKLDKQQTYYVYCAMGGRSSECTDKMKTLGFNHVYELDGGFNAWKKSGLPVQVP